MTSATAVDYLKSNLWTLTFFIIVSPIFWALRITGLPVVPTMEKETGRNDLNKEKLKTLELQVAAKFKSLFFYCVALRAN